VPDAVTAANGAVIRVPIQASGAWAWERAEVDPEATEARLAAGAVRLTRLQASDPGGDLTL
jgi:hypothetical protein